MLTVRGHTVIKPVCLRQEARLNQLHFAWNVDQQTAMWHHLLHEARRFKACPGLSNSYLRNITCVHHHAEPVGALHGCLALRAEPACTHGRAHGAARCKQNLL